MSDSVNIPDLQANVEPEESEAHKQANMFEERPRFVLEQCCFCCIPLRTGNLILGYLFLVATLVGFVLATFALVALSLVIDHPNVGPYRNVLVQAIVIMSIVEFLNLVALPFAIVLLVGLHKNKRNYVKIFTIFLLVCMVINVTQRVVSLINFSEKLVVDVLTTLAYIVFNTYFVVVLRSHYYAMREHSNNLPPHLASDGHLGHAHKV